MPAGGRICPKVECLKLSKTVSQAIQFDGSKMSEREIYERPYNF
jgi:hypothetical protein